MTITVFVGRLKIHYLKTFSPDFPEMYLSRKFSLFILILNNPTYSGVLSCSPRTILFQQLVCTEYRKGGFFPSSTEHTGMFLSQLFHLWVKSTGLTVWNCSLCCEVCVFNGVFQSQHNTQRSLCNTINSSRILDKHPKSDSLFLTHFKMGWFA